MNLQLVYIVTFLSFARGMLERAGVGAGYVFLPLGHVLMACWSWRLAAVLSGGLIYMLSGVVNVLVHLQQSTGSVSAACFSPAHVHIFKATFLTSKLPAELIIC